MIAASVSSARFATGVRVAPTRAVVARCMKAPEPETDGIPPSTSAGGVKDAASAIALDVPSQAVDTPVLGPVQELINGRAAMLGVVAAAVSEAVTGQTVWSQIAGKYVNGEIVERAHGTSTLYFAAIVVIFTMASLAPKFMSEDDSKPLQPADKEFGPFRASAEMLNGRAAMLGFAALLAVELVKQSPIF